MRDLIVGTAGHIDHGKTSLVRALTGIDPDRLEEEKRRGITIDIGFAHLQLEDLRAGFIDVPGHEKFVKNMLAGIGGINLLLLVIAADESVMPQTIEHFEICRLLEIPRGIIVLTKKNLADPDLRQVVAEEAQELVRGSFLETAPVLEVDSLSGEGIPELRERIKTELEAIDTAALDYRTGHHVFQLPIDRVFSIKGFGTVVTGSSIAGSLEREAAVSILPSKRPAKVRGIEIFGESADIASVGQRTALNLSGVTTSDLGRGMIVVPAGSLEASPVIDVSLQLLSTAPAPLKERTTVRFHHGSSETIATAKLLGLAQLEPGKRGFARLSLADPMVCLPGDRFVLRRYSPVETIGGGTVVNNMPPRRVKGDSQELLERYARLLPTIGTSGPSRTSALARFHVSERRLDGMSIRELVSATGIREGTLRTAILQDPELLLVDQEPAMVLSRQALSAAAVKARALLEEYHRSKPLSPGISREEFKEKLLPRGSSLQFQTLLRELQQKKILEVSGSVIALFGSSIALTGEEESISSAIQRLFLNRGFESPSLDQIKAAISGDPGKIQSVYYFLLQSGTLVRISDDVVLLQKQLAEMVRRLRESAPAGTPFSVPQFKDWFGISRKYAIPLLEYFDRTRITRRSGDARLVLPPSP